MHAVPSLAGNGVSSVARLGLAALLAAAVTLALFWGMQHLIGSADRSLADADRVQFVDFVRIKREEVTETKKPKPEKPPKVKPPPPPPPSLKLDKVEPKVHGVEISIPEATVDMKLSGSGFSLGLGEGDYLPLVKIAPIYPRRAAARGLEGYCIVEYTVTASGTTRDVALVPDACSHSLFEKPSLEAAAKFKYKPRIVDGQAIEVTGVRNKFSYELQK